MRSANIYNLLNTRKKPINSEMNIVVGIKNSTLTNQLSLNSFRKSFFKNKLQNKRGDNLFQH